MKKIIILFLVLVVFALFSCVSNTETPGERWVYDNQGLVVVSKKGGVILEKTSGYSYSYRIKRYIEVPVFVLICEGDTVIWKRVPIEIYNKYNQGDIIGPFWL